MRAKGILTASMITIAAWAFAGSTVDISKYEDAFKDFATDMAGSLAVSSTIGANWSDAYVGKFPHLGLGLTAGGTFVSPDSTSKLFTAMGADTPSGIDQVGIPIPVAVGTFKIGLPWIPMDLGIKLGFLPSSVAKSLMDSSGSEIKYMNWGLQARYALLKQGPGLMPNVSVGLAFNHVNGSVTVPTGAGTTTYDFPNTPYYIQATEPAMDLSWKSNALDITAQISKKFFIIVPYAGAGLTLGKSSVTGGVASDITTNYPGADIDAKLAALKSYLESTYGYDIPDIDSHGFSYTVDKTTPLFRLYGGMSLRIVILDLDLQAMYVPQTSSLGASFTGRIQF